MFKETAKSGIMTDSRMKRFIGSVMEWKDDIYTVHLTDIDESFDFEGKENVQEFLNEQVSERFYDKEIRKGYFDYVNDAGNTLRYTIKGLFRGKITDFTEEVIR